MQLVNNTVNNVAPDSVVTDLTMGNQSQLRNGAIRKCKKQATKTKTKRVYTQNAIRGDVTFIAAEKPWKFERRNTDWCILSIVWHNIIYILVYCIQITTPAIGPNSIADPTTLPIGHCRV
jgi:hypothetical protein